tara:strand:+ start:899 stop:1243 length:345 start_codon:yes stop_codon:yes gene_type:complete
MTPLDVGQKQKIMDVRMPDFVEVQQNGMAVYVFSKEQYMKVRENRKLNREIRDYLDMVLLGVDSNKTQALFDYIDAQLSDKHLDEIDVIFSRSVRRVVAASDHEDGDITHPMRP